MLIYFALALGIGVIWALQPIINAGLAKSVGTLMASTISFAIGLVLLIFSVLAVHLFCGEPIGVSSLQDVHPYYYLGGVIGAIVVLGMTFIVPRFGAGATLSSAITGQLIMAALIDQFGLFGAPQTMLSWPRLLGILFLLTGVNLVIHK